MSQIETEVDVISEICAGRKLKNVSIIPGSHQNCSLITFVFEGDNNEEWYIPIYGEGLTVSFGKRKK